MAIREPLGGHGGESASHQAERRGQNATHYSLHSRRGIRLFVASFVGIVAKKVYLLRVHQVVLGCFVLAALSLALAAHFAPQLYVRPQWHSETEALQSAAETSGVAQILRYLSQIESREQQIALCASTPLVWKVEESGHTLWSCLQGTEFPGRNFFVPLEVKVEGASAFWFEPPSNFPWTAQHSSRLLWRQWENAFSPQLERELVKSKDERMSLRDPIIAPHPRRFTPPIYFEYRAGSRVTSLVMPLELKPPGSVFEKPVMLMASATTLVLVFLFFAIRFVLSPFRDVENALVEYGKGNFSYRPRIQGAAEFSRIGSVVVDMAVRIEQLVESKNRLLLDVSHELKTPLARLRVHAALAKDDASELGNVDADAVEMANLVQRILDNARAANSVDALDISEVSLFDIVNAEVHKIGSLPQVVANGVTLHVHKFDQSCTIWGDKKMLATALGNVLTNAVQYCASAGGVVSVTVNERDNCRFVDIENNGEAISPDHWEKIFDPFFRVDTSRSRATGGHGLGLAIARRIVAEHGGTLKVVCGESGRVCFRFEFPMSSKFSRNS